MTILLKTMWNPRYNSWKPQTFIFTTINNFESTAKVRIGITRPTFSASRWTWPSQYFFPGLHLGRCTRDQYEVPEDRLSMGCDPATVESFSNGTRFATWKIGGKVKVLLDPEFLAGSAKVQSCTEQHQYLSTVCIFSSPSTQSTPATWPKTTAI